MNKEFIQAIEDLEKERHIPKDVLKPSSPP